MFARRHRLLLCILSLSGIQVQLSCAPTPEADELAFEILAEETPERLEVGVEVTVAVRLRNEGTLPWRPAAPDYLSYQWLDEASELAVADGLRTPLPGPVAPGEEVMVAAALLPPPAPGSYRLKWNLVREGVAWFEPRETPQRVLTTVSVPPSPFRWELVKVKRPRLIWNDSIQSVALTLRNIGDEPWSPLTMDRLSYRFQDLRGGVIEWGGLRTNLPHEVPPGGEVQLEAQLRGPERAGLRVLAWEMVKEWDRWYGPPLTGRAPDSIVLVLSRLHALQLGLLLVTAVAVFGLRRTTRPIPSWLLGALPVAWAWAALTALSLSFNHLEFRDWRGDAPVLMATAALFAAPLALFPRRVRAWGAFVWVAALTFLAWADLIHLRAFDSTVPLTALWSAHQIRHVDESIAELARSADAWLVLTPIAGLLLALAWPVRKRSWIVAGQSPTRWPLRAAALLVLLAASVPAPLELWRAIGENGLAERVFHEQRTLIRYGVLHTHLFNAARHGREVLAIGEPTPAERRALRGFFDERAGERATGGPLAGIARGANLLILQLESTDAWPIGLEVEGQELTPTLNRLRDQAFYYPRFFDQTNEGRTSDAEFLVLNSLHPLGSGALVFRRARNRFVALPQVLAARGYTTLSAHAYEQGFWNRATIHPRYGFETSLFSRGIGEPEPGETIGWGLADGIFFDRMLPVLEDLRQPWFAFLITLTVHHPYKHLPTELRELSFDDQDDDLVWDYLHTLHYTDRMLGEFLRRLRNRGLLDNTLVAIYGDHDSGLPLSPRVVDLLGRDRVDATLKTRMEQVPFYVLLPGRETGRSLATVGGHIDVGPTLLYLLGIDTPRSFLGRPLLPGSPGRAVLSDGAVVAQQRIFVQELDRARPEGACFRYPLPQPLPLDRCQDLKSEGARELHIARQVVLQDLAGEIAGED